MTLVVIRCPTSTLSLSFSGRTDTMRTVCFVTPIGNSRISTFTRSAERERERDVERERASARARARERERERERESARERERERESQREREKERERESAADTALERVPNFSISEFTSFFHGFYLTECS